MRLLFKRLTPEAKIPTKAYEGDFCYDVTAVSCEEIAPNVYKYGLGFALAIDRDDNHLETGRDVVCVPLNGINPEDIILAPTGEGENTTATVDEKLIYKCAEYAKPYVTSISNINISIDLRARSSVWKHGMTLANSVGTIDEGYRGELAMIFYHVIPSLPKYEVGDAIGQMKIGFTTPVEFKVVDELPPSERDAKGFGSSDKKREEQNNG